MEEDMVETAFFTLVGLLLYPPLAVMRIYSTLRHYGAWMLVPVGFLALALDGAYLHPFGTATLGLLLLAETFAWNWKKMGSAMTVLALVWGYLVSWWVLLLVPLLWVEAWADA